MKNSTSNYCCSQDISSVVQLISFSLLMSLPFLTKAQKSSTMLYESSTEYPYGRPNPDAPKQLSDYAPMIGVCDCTSESIKPDGTWAEPVKMTWMFKYIMNGTAVQDQTLKEDGAHSGSIRQYSVDSAKWYVHYYSTSKISSVSGYHGNMNGGEMVLYKTISDIKTPAGVNAYFRLTFYDISNNGFNWRGEWVDKTTQPDTVLGTTWKITCKKRKE